MAAKTSNFQRLLDRIITDYPEIAFAEGKSFYWSPAKHQVIYKRGATGPTASFSLLHELGHALLGHQRYKLDFELLELEVAAWEQATQLARSYGIAIDDDHIQDCLDSYRDWLYRRSICPTCTAIVLQQDDQPAYRCFNCQTTWRVAPSRFCRPYRRQKVSSPGKTARATANTPLFASSL